MFYMSLMNPKKILQFNYHTLPVTPFKKVNFISMIIIIIVMNVIIVITIITIIIKSVKRTLS